MQIDLIQYGHLAWRVTLWPLAQARGEAPSAAPISGLPAFARPLWTQDNYPSAASALADAEAVAAYLMDLSPAA